jgi:hypothetical protein
MDPDTPWRELPIEQTPDPIPDFVAPGVPLPKAKAKKKSGAYPEIVPKSDSIAEPGDLFGDGGPPPVRAESPMAVQPPQKPPTGPPKPPESLPPGERPDPDMRALAGEEARQRVPEPPKNKLQAAKAIAKQVKDEEKQAWSEKHEPFMRFVGRKAEEHGSGTLGTLKRTLEAVDLDEKGASGRAIAILKSIKDPGKYVDKQGYLAKVPLLQDGDIQQLIDVLSGRPQPGAQRRVQTLAKQIRAFMDDIAQRATDHKVEVPDKDDPESFRVFERLEDYLPTVFERDANGGWRTASGSGQFTGNLMRHRSGEGGREITPEEFVEILTDYVRRANRTIAEAKYIGKSQGLRPGVTVKDWIKQTAQDAFKETNDPAIGDYITKFLPYVMGKELDTTDAMKATLNRRKNFNTATKLNLAGVANPAQQANIPMMTDTRSYVRGLLKTFIGPDKAKEFAENAGSLVSSNAQQIKGGSNATPMGRVATWTLENNAFSPTEKMNRIVATVSGALHVDDLVKIAKGQKVFWAKKLTPEQAKAALTEMHLDAEKMVERGHATEEERALGGLWISERTQFSDAREYLPPTWIQSPQEMANKQFKSYANKQLWSLYDQAKKSLKEDNGKALLRWAAIAVPYGYFVQKKFKDIILGRERDDSKAELLFDTVLAGATLDRFAFMLNAAKRGDFNEMLGSPTDANRNATARFAAQIIDNAEKKVKGKEVEEDDYGRMPLKRASEQFALSIDPSLRIITNRTEANKEYNQDRLERQRDEREEEKGWYKRFISPNQ